MKSMLPGYFEVDDGDDNISYHEIHPMVFEYKI